MGSRSFFFFFFGWSNLYDFCIYVCTIHSYIHRAEWKFFTKSWRIFGGGFQKKGLTKATKPQQNRMSPPLQAYVPGIPLVKRKISEACWIRTGSNSFLFCITARRYEVGAKEFFFFFSRTWPAWRKVISYRRGFRSADGHILPVICTQLWIFLDTTRPWDLLYWYIEIRIPPCGSSWDGDRIFPGPVRGNRARLPPQSSPATRSLVFIWQAGIALALAVQI